MSGLVIMCVHNGCVLRPNIYHAVVCHVQESSVLCCVAPIIHHSRCLAPLIGFV